jgi:hypothetical protein
MLRAAVLATVVAALVLGGCGDDSSDESRPAATASATSAPSGYYEAMDELVTDLDRAVAAAISGDAGATKRINAVIKGVRAELRESGETPAGNLVLTTAASARDYAANKDREGLKLIRRIPIVETRDALRSEAAG